MLSARRDVSPAKRFFKKMMTAEGERVSEYGRVEIYVVGELVDVLTAEPCRDLPVGMCEK